MENWAQAVALEEQFKGKILHAKQVHRHLEGLRFLNARMIETLAATDFRLTFRTMQRLIPQTGSLSKWYEENLDENDDTSSTRVYFDFMRVGNQKAFLELHFTNDDASDDF